MRLCLQLVQRKSSEADTEAMREEFQQRISSAERKVSSDIHVCSNGRAISSGKNVVMKAFTLFY